MKKVFIINYGRESHDFHEVSGIEVGMGNYIVAENEADLKEQIKKHAKVFGVDFSVNTDWENGNATVFFLD
jgi:hypothetical protein